MDVQPSKVPFTEVLLDAPSTWRPLQQKSDIEWVRPLAGSKTVVALIWTLYEETPENHVKQHQMNWHTCCTGPRSLPFRVLSDPAPSLIEEILAILLGRAVDPSRLKA